MARTGRSKGLAAEPQEQVAQDLLEEALPVVMAAMAETGVLQLVAGVAIRRTLQTDTLELPALGREGELAVMAEAK